MWTQRSPESFFRGQRKRQDRPAGCHSWTETGFGYQPVENIKSARTHISKIYLETAAVTGRNRNAWPLPIILSAGTICGLTGPVLPKNELKI